jgi:hypothetical protein
MAAKLVLHLGLQVRMQPSRSYCQASTLGCVLMLMTKPGMDFYPFLQYMIVANKNEADAEARCASAHSDPVLAMLVHADILHCMTTYCQSLKLHQFLFLTTLKQHWQQLLTLGQR